MGWTPRQLTVVAPIALGVIAVVGYVSLGDEQDDPTRLIEMSGCGPHLSLDPDAPPFEAPDWEEIDACHDLERAIESQRNMIENADTTVPTNDPRALVNIMAGGPISNSRTADYKLRRDHLGSPEAVSATLDILESDTVETLYIADMTRLVAFLAAVEWTEIPPELSQRTLVVLDRVGASGANELINVNQTAHERIDHVQFVLNPT